MASPFDYAWVFLKGFFNTPIATKKPYNIKRPDRFGNIEYDNQTIQSGPENARINDDVANEREKLRQLASRLELPHKDIPYPVPPEMLEDMKRWDEMTNPQ